MGRARLPPDEAWRRRRRRLESARRSRQFFKKYDSKFLFKFNDSSIQKRKDLAPSTYGNILFRAHHHLLAKGNHNRKSSLILEFPSTIKTFDEKKGVFHANSKTLSALNACVLIGSHLFHPIISINTLTSAFANSVTVPMMNYRLGTRGLVACDFCPIITPQIVCHR
ncbi:hypothetical protein CDAR_436391 [Caerostris darwini]|uniref:Uncharacterized protein n=1 Tax=Caerostris darwini TaxID=1538125 RepID=A0AAV4RA56_9ARAC|nr:hypothetical protein CDAR_436391 [Caerostris darwini]